MSSYFTDGMDNLGPRKRAAVAEFLDWLNATYPAKQQTVLVCIQDSSVVRCEALRQVPRWIRGTGIIGFFDPAKQPRIYAAGRQTITALREILAHEWSHVLQFVHKTESADDAEAEARAETFAVAAVAAYHEARGEV